MSQDNKCIVYTNVYLFLAEELLMTLFTNQLTIKAMDGIVTNYSAINICVCFSIVCVMCRLEQSFNTQIIYYVEYLYNMLIHTSFVFVLTLSKSLIFSKKFNLIIHLLPKMSCYRKKI